MDSGQGTLAAEQLPPHEPQVKKAEPQNSALPSETGRETHLVAKPCTAASPECRLLRRADRATVAVSARKAWKKQPCRQGAGFE